jgi:hypothetical protein
MWSVEFFRSRRAAADQWQQQRVVGDAIDGGFGQRYATG